MVQRRPLILTVIFIAIMPVGFVIISIGWEGLFDDLGASWSPIGLMIVGVGLLGTWFNGVRVLAARELLLHTIARSEVVTKYNQTCAFTGQRRMELITSL